MTRVQDQLPAWHVACRADLPIAPDSISGILDGDGCLTLVRRGQRPVPTVVLGMRDDDPLPVAVARSIASYVGRPIGHLTHARNTTSWRVTAIGDIASLLRFLDRHPLQTPRGAAHQSILAEATAVLQAVHARGGNSERITGAEVDRLEALWGAVGRRSLRPQALPLPHSAREADDSRFGSWLAGFVAAEGHLGVHRFGSRRQRPLFSVSQRDDNLATLSHIQDRLGIGRIHPTPITIGWPASSLVATRTSHLEVLASRLRMHPVPYASPKAAQLDAWIELVALTKAAYRTRIAGAGGLDQSITALAAELRERKTYAGKVGLCLCPEPEGSDATA